MTRSAERYFIFAGFMLAAAAGFGVWGVEHLKDDSSQAWIAAVGTGVALGVVASAALIWHESRKEESPERTTRFARDFWTGVVVLAALGALGALLGDLVPDWLKAGAAFGAGIVGVVAAALTEALVL